MRVRADRAFKTYVGGTLLRASEGSVWEGGSARAMLASRCPVTELEEEPIPEPEEPEGDTETNDEQDHQPAQQDEIGFVTGNVSDVLDWVGDNPERAKAALEAERSKERPRASLIKQLNKLAE